MLNNDILSNSVPLSQKPRLLRTPTPLALAEDILTLHSDTNSRSPSPTSSSFQDSAVSSSSAPHTIEKRKCSTEADAHFHDNSSHDAATISNDHPVNTTSGEHAATSSSGDALRKILESRRRIQELLARHAREEDSAIARLTKENTIYNKTLHHIPTPIFPRSSRRCPFKRRKSATSSSSRAQREISSDKAPSCLRHASTSSKGKAALPALPCSEVLKSPDYQADDELDESEDEDCLITDLALSSPPPKRKLSILEPIRSNKRARQDHEYERAKVANLSPQHATSREPMISEARHQIQSHPIDSAPRQTKAVRFDDSLNSVVAYRAQDPARELSFSGESTGDSSPSGATQDVAWPSPSDSFFLPSPSSTAPPTSFQSSPDLVSSLTAFRTSSSTKRKSSPSDPSETPRPLKRPNRDSLSPPRPNDGSATAARLPMLRRQSSSVSLLDTMSS